MADEITQITFYVKTVVRDKVLEKLEKLGIVQKGNVTIQKFPQSHTFAKYVTEVENLETVKCINCNHDERSHEPNNTAFKCYGLVNNSLCKCIKFIKAI